MAGRKSSQPSSRAQRDFAPAPNRLNLLVNNAPWGEATMSTADNRRAFLYRAVSAAALVNLGLAGPSFAAPAPTGAKASAGAKANGLAILDATAQADLVRRKQVTPTELVDAAVTRINAMNPEVNAVITKLYERARQRAAQPVGEGPFPGVPYLLKDLVGYEGALNQSGSRALLGMMGRQSSPYVQRTEAAGLIVLGMTNTPEFGAVDTTEPLSFGPSCNPWDLTRSTGGSSGGAAAAVASGMVAIANATDGGGSIRIPASHCGLFGLKPSRNRMVAVRPPPPPPMPDLSVPHCVSRSVRDSATLFAWNERPAGAEGGLPPVGLVTGPSKRRLKIGYMTHDFTGAAPNPEVAQAIAATAKLCAGLGHKVEIVKSPLDGQAFGDAFLDIWTTQLAGAVKSISAMLKREPGPDIFEPLTLDMVQYAGKVTPEQLARDIATLNQAGQAMSKFFERYDVILSAVVNNPPKKLGAHDTTKPFAEIMPVIAANVAYTPVYNAWGGPAMSVPLGWTKSGLPVGSHFGADIGNERTLLELAFELERAQPWAKRWAPYSYPRQA